MTKRQKEEILMILGGKNEENESILEETILAYENSMWPGEVAPEWVYWDTVMSLAVRVKIRLTEFKKKHKK